MGSDEFAIIQPGIEGDSDATSLAERVIEVVRQPYDIDGHKIVVGASVGTAIGRYDAVTADILMCNADLALYHAKLERRGSFRLFSPEIDARVRAQRSLESDLRSALADGQFELNFQPLFSAKRREDQRLRSSHALASSAAWACASERVHSRRRTHRAHCCTRRICIARSLHDCRALARAPAHSGQSLAGPVCSFRSRESRIRRTGRSGLAPNRLELEITETVLLQNSQATRDTLFELRALGVRIALDDFGTGYSSLSYLLSFPFDKIKIDRSFIEDIVANSRSQKIVKAVVAMASDLDMETTAEGIETDEQLAAVCKAGCTEVQGYLLGRPQPARDVDKLVADLPARRGAKQSAKSPRKRQAASTHRSVGSGVRH